jgi:ADP-ribose pyrophosphatase YjhB (NUDIX family)
MSIPVGNCINGQIINASQRELEHVLRTSTGEAYERILVCVTALRHTTPDPDFPASPSILLLKRLGYEMQNPNAFELPTGNMNAEDATTKHAIVRELKEKTGLNVVAVNAEVWPMAHRVEDVGVGYFGQEVVLSRSSIQLNYIVSVADGNVTLNSGKHSESIWATEEEVDSLDISGAMRVVIRDAFRWIANDFKYSYLREN